MPHYFFDTDDGTEQFRDEIGLDLRDDQAARDEASPAMGELASEYLPGGPPQKNITMWIRNDRGEPVLQLAFTFAIQPVR